MSIEMQVYPGESFYRATERAIYTAYCAMEHVVFAFNDINIEVSPFSCEADICTIYDLKCQLRRLKR